MLTQLATLKSRLAIDPFDIKDDTLLTNLIALVTARFDNQTNRKLAYAQNITDDFQGDETELRLSYYPVDETQPITFQKLSTNQLPTITLLRLANSERRRVRPSRRLHHFPHLRDWPLERTNPRHLFRRLRSARFQPSTLNS
jgi:hypothetical protein